MKEWFSDWRLYIFLYILFSGIWGVIIKISISQLDYLTVTFFAVISAAIVVILFTFRNIQWEPGWGMVCAILGGILGGFASIVFYKALHLGPANIIIPLSSLYLIITVLLSVIFLKEHLETRQILGVCLAILACILLGK